MASPDEEIVRGIWVGERAWSEICEKAGLRCRLCCDPPEVEDAEFFLEEGCCPDCAARFKKMMRD